MKYKITDQDVKTLREMQATLAEAQWTIEMLRGLTGKVGSGGGFSPIAYRDFGKLIPVALTQTGGSAGTSGAQCSFTYTVKDIYSVETLGTAIGLTGNGARVANMAMTAATYGLAYRDRDGTIKLIWADEKAQQTNCT